MKRDEIPVCSFPTTVFFIDDDRTYLENLQLRLQVEKFLPKFFHSSKNALEYLQQNFPFETFAERCIHRPDEMELDHRNIDIDVPAIREEIYNPKRFSQVSVVVVDYSMPNLNGLELCKKLKNKRFKKILLTGEADEKIAVNAFNDGIIDKFIRKDAPHFNELINKTICQLQQQYFQELSTLIIESLVDPEFPILTAINDPVFIEIFNEFCKKNNITEYYLTDTYGSYLLLDGDANPSWIAIKDENGMEGAYQVAKFSDTPFPLQMLQEMKNREKILYLYEAGGLSDKPEECAASLYPAKKLIGENNFYYAFIRDKKAYDIRRGRVISYQEYLEQQNAEKIM